MNNIDELMNEVWTSKEILYAYLIEEYKPIAEAFKKIYKIIKESYKATDILPALKCEGSAYRLSWLSTTISRIYSPCPDERALCSGYRYTKLINNYFGDSSPL